MGLFDTLKAKANEVIQNNANAQPKPNYEEIKRQRELYLNNKMQEFETTLLNIPNYQITKSANFQRSDDEYLYNFSNVTSKTSYDNLSNFVVVDLETTSVSKQSKIVELSAIRFEGFKPIEKFDCLIKPKGRIPEKATEINGITNEMVANSPTIDEVAESFINFISDSNIVGHNLEFDLCVLEHSGIVFVGKRKYYDTYLLAQKVLKKPKGRYNSDIEEYEIDYDSDYDVENYKLETLCDFYNIFRKTSHRGASDCLATGLLFKNIVEDITD